MPFKLFTAFATGLALFALSGCDSWCFHETVSTVPSPSGSQTAVVSIHDCGGATTDFWGKVDVISDNPRLAAENLYGFAGRPEETGLKIYWDSDTELRISIDSLAKARRFNPDGRVSADLKVEYEFRQPVNGKACLVSCGFDRESDKACFQMPVVNDYMRGQLLPGLDPVVGPIVVKQPPGACFCSLAELDDTGKFVSVTVTDTSDERMGNEIREAILDYDAIPIPSGAECVVGVEMPLIFWNN